MTIAAEFARLAHMASTREQLRDLAAKTPRLTATYAAGVLGVSRQRVSELAEEEGIQLAKYVRASADDRATRAAIARGRRVSESLGKLIARAESARKDLDHRLTRATRRTR